MTPASLLFAAATKSALAVEAALDARELLLRLAIRSRHRQPAARTHIRPVFACCRRLRAAARRISDRDALNRLRARLAKVCANFQSELLHMESQDHHVERLPDYFHWFERLLRELGFE